jgi:hypothetical protein
MDQFIDTIGLRRMIGEMPPQIMIAIEPARACDPMDECGDDPPLRLFLIEFSVIMIGERLMCQSIDGLAVLARLDDVPAGMSLACQIPMRSVPPGPARPWRFSIRACNPITNFCPAKW